MLCLLRVELELSIQAKAMLIARDAGMMMPVAPGCAERRRRDPLSAIVDRPTGLLALSPVQVTSHRDDWHRYLFVGSDSARMRWLRRLQFWKA